MKPDLKKVEADAKADYQDKEAFWSMFRCHDPNCNALLTQDAHSLGRCGQCQGVKFIVARYLTEDEDAAIKAGTLHPHKVQLSTQAKPLREVH